MGVSILAPLLERGLANLEHMLGTPTVVWQGHTLPCVVSSERNGTVLEIGGHAIEVELTIIIRKSVLDAVKAQGITIDSTLIFIDNTDIKIDNAGTDIPRSGKALVRRGKRYRVLSVRDSSSQSHYSYDCASPHR
jgi:hypothetical protein